MPRTTENMFTYNYCLQDTQIRLLRLLPGSDDQEFIGCLLAVDFDRNASPQYEALSYTWGKPLFDAAIFFNDDQSDGLARKFKITTDLAVALRHLRRADKERILWIDQICINQHDATEKSTQVNNMMADIYRRTSALIVWLGAADSETGIAFDTIEGTYQSLPKGPGLSYQERIALRREHMVEPSTGVFNAIEWRAVYNLLRRPWFERTWVS